MSDEQPDPMETVELHPAHMWDCTKCGSENFCRGVTVEFSAEDRREMAERYGTPDGEWVTGHWMTSPDEVACSACGATFAARDQRENDDGD